MSCRSPGRSPAATPTRTSRRPSGADLRRHNIFKLKIGKRAVADDVAHVAAIKQALGDKASVRVDVNQAWDEASVTRTGDARGRRVDLVEQPIAKGEPLRTGTALGPLHHPDHGR